MGWSVSVLCAWSMSILFQRIPKMSPQTASQKSVGWVWIKMLHSQNGWSSTEKGQFCWFICTPCWFIPRWLTTLTYERDLQPRWSCTLLNVCDFGISFLPHLLLLLLLHQRYLLFHSIQQYAYWKAWPREWNMKRTWSTPEMPTQAVALWCASQGIVHDPCYTVPELAEIHSNLGGSYDWQLCHIL